MSRACKAQIALPILAFFGVASLLIPTQGWAAAVAYGAATCCTVSFVIAFCYALPEETK